MSQDRNPDSMAETPSGFRLTLLENKVKDMEDSDDKLVERLAVEHKDNSTKLDSQSSKLDNLTWKIDSILVQTTRTNGRVSKAEEEIISMKSWKDKMLGAWFALTTLAALGAWFLGKYGPKP